MSRHKVVGHNGDPCPRCGKPTEIREHTEIGERELRRPFYYSRWFNCTNKRCKTTLIMPERFKVLNNDASAATRSARSRPPDPDLERRLAAVAEQLAPPGEAITGDLFGDSSPPASPGFDELEPWDGESPPWEEQKKRGT
jgi:hypothetical protein